MEVIKTKYYKWWKYVWIKVLPIKQGKILDFTEEKQLKTKKN